MYELQHMMPWHYVHRNFGLLDRLSNLRTFLLESFESRQAKYNEIGDVDLSGLKLFGYVNQNVEGQIICDTKDFMDTLAFTDNWTTYSDNNFEPWQYRNDELPKGYMAFDDNLARVIVGIEGSLIQEEVREEFWNKIPGYSAEVDWEVDWEVNTPPPKEETKEKEKADIQHDEFFAKLIGIVYTFGRADGKLLVPLMLFKYES